MSPERKLACRKWYLSHKEQSYIYHKKWVSNHREQSRATWRKYDKTAKGQAARKRRNRTRMDLRNNLLVYYKTRPCADCNQFYDFWQMDFDHRPGTIKKFCVGANRLAGLKALIDEIRKCDVVCANCHRTRTRNRWKESKCN